MKIKNVIFDLDGVLLDTTEGFVESVQFAAEKMGLEPLPEEHLKELIGPPIQSTFLNHYHCMPEQVQEASNLFRDYYKNIALFKAVPYDGIFDCCAGLKKANIKTAVATYKREDYALDLLKHFGFDRYFDVMHGADNENRLTKADIIDLCIAETDSEKTETVLIGDTAHDAVGAQNAGIAFIAVTYGFGFKENNNIEFPHIGVASKPSEIIDILYKNEYDYK